MHTFRNLLVPCLLLTAIGGCPCIPPIDPRQDVLDPAEQWTDPPRDLVTDNWDLPADEAAAVVERYGGMVVSVDDKAGIITVTYTRAGATPLKQVGRFRIRNSNR
ncbi:hypothetical protein HY633_03505 [Candidatus Uhrbacteria bacterium]|nr:hypothetical protein [Candidatus Uhrbacteria bacterium]